MVDVCRAAAVWLGWVGRSFVPISEGVFTSYRVWGGKLLTPHGTCKEMLQAWLARRAHLPGALAVVE